MPGSVQVNPADPRPLIDRAQRLATAGRRRMLGLTGAPGAGKSTVAHVLAEAFAPAAVLVPMDGFHLAEAELHRLGRHDRKGAIDTFDAAGFVALLRRLRDPDPEVVYAPVFNRGLEEAVAGAIPVSPDVPLVITEGNYLLVDRGPWAQVRALLDEVWFVRTDERLRRERLVSRHVAFGRTAPEAAARADGSDQRNADLIAATRGRADLIVELSCDRAGPG